MILQALSRGAIQLLSPGGTNGRLSIFIFHRVLPGLDPLLPSEPSAEQFDWMVRFIARSFNVLPLQEAAELLARRRLPPGAAAITFDDGYADNLAVAWPILARYRVPATFFIATAFLDGGRMWNDDIIEAVRRAPEGMLDWTSHDLGAYPISDAASRVACYEQVLARLKYFTHHRRSSLARELSRNMGTPDDSSLMLTSTQLREIRAAGAEIGAHTDTHPILESIDDRDALREMALGKEKLEAAIGESVHLFAYPNGRPVRDYSERHVQMVKKLGFRAAVSTQMGVARWNTDPFQLPRFTPWDRTEAKFALRCAANLL
jgi:peptidoglycan/xylan/chitin deacetylase (PgdA/CDA1 family)